MNFTVNDFFLLVCLTVGILGFVLITGAALAKLRKLFARESVGEGRKAMKRLAFALFALMTLCACVAIIVISVGLRDLIALTQGSDLAYALAPPEYPESKLIYKYHPVGTESMGDMRTYRTTDNVQTVLSFMEEHMPGFYFQDSSLFGPAFYNSRADKSDHAKRIARFACTSMLCDPGDEAWTYPSVGVIIHTDPENSTGTLIELSFFWPAP